MKPFLRLSSIFVAASFALLLIIAGVHASGVLFWQANGVPVSVAPYGQTDPQAISDGAGGMIVAWQDFRSGTNQDIYIQRVNSAGQVQWSMNGVPVSVAAGDQQAPAITSDGQKGAIIVWQDKRNGTDFDIYAQHVLSNGVAIWSTNGLTICNATGVQDYPQITSDGQGGAIIVWEDGRSGTHYDVYAQRVSANGTTLWTSNGIGLNDSMPFPQSPPYPTIMSDGDNGAYIAWAHTENYSTHVRAQRVLSDGVSMWSPGGITVGLQMGVYPMLVSDGAGGAIVAWSSYPGVYAQRLLPTGLSVWGPNGIALDSGGAANVFSVEDGLHGAFVAWQRFGSGYTTSNIIVQHVLSDSTLGWVGAGVTTTSISGLQQVPRLVNDGLDGVIVVWQTAADLAGSDYSIWSQRLDSMGASQWGVDGIQIISHTANGMHSTLVSDLMHGAIVAWEDQRNDVGDVYAQRIVDFTPTTSIFLPLVTK